MKTITVQSIKTKSGTTFLDLNDNDFFSLTEYEMEIFEIDGLNVTGSDFNIDVLMEKFVWDGMGEETDFNFDDVTKKTDTKDELVSALTMSSNRAPTPASAKQINYLACLMFEACDNAQDIGCGLVNSMSSLSSKTASFYINVYTN